MSEEDGGQTQCANYGEEATPLNTAWCHADWRRSGVLGWRKPKPAANKLFSDQLELTDPAYNHFRNRLYLFPSLYLAYP